MYYTTVTAKRTTGRKVRLVINEVVREGKPTYYAKVIFKEMNYFIALSPKEKQMLCSKLKN